MKKNKCKNPVCQILIQRLPFKIYEGMCRQTEANLTKTNPSQLPEKSFTNAFLLQTCQKNICHLWWHLKMCCNRCWFCTFQKNIYHLWWHLKICCLRCLLGGWVLPTNRKVKLKNKHRVALFAHARLSAFTKIQIQIQPYKSENADTKI